jgi:hypothetical protein
MKPIDTGSPGSEEIVYIEGQEVKSIKGRIVLDKLGFLRIQREDGSIVDVNTKRIIRIERLPPRE